MTWHTCPCMVVLAVLVLPQAGAIAVESRRRMGVSGDSATTSAHGRTSRQMHNTAGFVYVGCYKDDPSDRDLATQKSSDPHMTPAKCHAECAGYDYFAVQISRCWCGNSYGKHGIAQSQWSGLKNADNLDYEPGCHHDCYDEANFACGGVHRNSVYRRPSTMSASCHTAPHIQLIKEGHECGSLDTNLLLKPDLNACATAAQNAGARFFAYGVAGSDADRKCYSESMTQANCPEGWIVNNYNTYALASTQNEDTALLRSSAVCKPDQGELGTAVMPPGAEWVDTGHTEGAYSHPGMYEHNHQSCPGQHHCYKSGGILGQDGSVPIWSAEQSHQVA